MSTKKGRKLKYGEPTKMTVFRCPISKEKEVLKRIYKMLEEYIPTKINP